mmetsp:Transcript_32949/g.96159  ORF Transcript_32949/g.96159 Transcript_32949/m.96159 type:complete len:201 (+) Transcript_32949:691-1293(+)
MVSTGCTPEAAWGAPWLMRLFASFIRFSVSCMCHCSWSQQEMPSRPDAPESAQHAMARSCWMCTSARCSATMPGKTEACSAGGWNRGWGERRLLEVHLFHANSASSMTSSFDFDWPICLSSSGAKANFTHGWLQTSTMLKRLNGSTSNRPSTRPRAPAESFCHCLWSWCDCLERRFGGKPRQSITKIITPNEKESALKAS